MNDDFTNPPNNVPSNDAPVPDQNRPEIVRPTGMTKPEASNNQYPMTGPTPQTATPAQPSVQTVATQQPITGSGLQKKASKRKLKIVFSIVAILMLVIGGALAYFFLYYLPNRPEVVLNKAVISFVERPGNYNIVGKLDQAGPNDPDFTYKSATSTTGNASTELFMATFFQNPRLQTVKNGNKLYVQFSGFQDFKTMSQQYRNVGNPGIQEAIAAFAESSNVANNQQKWMQVGDFMLAQPYAPKAPAKIQGVPGAKLNTVGAVETINGAQARKYEVTLNQDAFKLLIGQLDKYSGAPMLSATLGSQKLTTSEVKIHVWVNLKSKTIEQLTYAGRPFENATFDIKISQAKSVNIQTVTGEVLTKQLSYGLVNSLIFNKAWQLGGTDNDKQRIADLKGIKTALEMYKVRTGNYPERYDMAVRQESLINGPMRGADAEIFKDPSGRYIGKSGSQYAYVPASDDGDQNCGKFAKPCSKYFIATTFDDGKKFQLNSD